MRCHLGGGLLGDGEVGAGEADDLAERAAVDPVALPVAQERLHAELVEQVEQRGLVGGDPLPAELEEGAVDDVAVRAAADAVAGLQHDDAAAGGLQAAGRHEAGRAGADHDDVALEHLGCGWVSTVSS